MATGALDSVPCSYCTIDTGIVYVHCCECEDDVNLCLECFASGAIPGSHERDHAYELVDNGTFSVLAPGWSAIDEMAIFEGIELGGFGNWEDCASHVVEKTADELKKHFEDVCVQGSLGQKFFPKDFHSNVLENQGGAVPPAQPDISLTYAASDLSPAHQRELGYMPFRGDFDQEEDNDAEQLVSTCSMSHLPHENDLESNLLMGHIEACTFRLMERQRRKVIIQNLRLLSSKQFTLSESGGSKVAARTDGSGTLLSGNGIEQKEELLKPFARFTGSEDSKALLKSLEHEQRLKAQIKQLQEFRRNGVTSISASHNFSMEQQRRERTKENSATKRRPSATNVPGRRSSVTAGQNKKMSSGESKASSSNHFSVSDVPLMTHGRFLSQRELLLCSQLQMKPSHYLSIKGLVIKDHVAKRHGVVSRSTRRFPPWLDKSHRKYILTFLRDCGWLRNS